jgi:hypothetical protein
MKWCRFQSGRTVTYGLIEGTNVTEVTGSPFESYSKTSNTTMASRVKMLVPVIPPTFYAAGAPPRRETRVPAQRRRRLPRQQRADRHR